MQEWAVGHVKQEVWEKKPEQRNSCLTSQCCLDLCVILSNSAINAFALKPLPHCTQPLSICDDLDKFFSLGHQESVKEMGNCCLLNGQVIQLTFFLERKTVMPKCMYFVYRLLQSGIWSGILKFHQHEKNGISDFGIPKKLC